MGRERESECASSRKRVEREGGTRKSVSASLLTAPGLRDSSSLCFPRCRFNSIPSVQSSFFLCLLYVLLLTALVPALRSPLSARQDKTVHLFIKSSPGTRRRAFLRRTLVKLQFHPGRGLSSVWLLWISPYCSASVLFGAADRLWELYLWRVHVSKDWWRWENLCFHTWEAVWLLLISAEDGISLPSTCVLPSDPRTSPSKRLPQDCRGVKTSGALSYSAGLSSLQENPFNCLRWNMNFHWLTFTSLCFSTRRKAGLHISL